MPILRRNFLMSTLALPASRLIPGRIFDGLATTVFNGNELHAALQAAGPGSVITLAPGSYGDIGGFALAGTGVSVRVQSPLSAIFRVPVVVEGEDLTLDGLSFEQGLTLTGHGRRRRRKRRRNRGGGDGAGEGGSGSSGGGAGLVVANSRFTSGGISVTGVNVEVDSCEIANFRARGIDIKGSARSPHVHHCYIHDAQGSSHPDHTAIGIGTSQADTHFEIDALIEYNLLERISQESEAITIKSSANTIQFNTLRDSRGFVSNRHGEDNLYAGNTLERTYGFVIQDRGTQLLGNRALDLLDGRPVRINGGSIAHDAVKQGEWPQAADTVISGNEFGQLVVGNMWSGFKYPAVNTSISDHKGPISYKSHVGTTVRAEPVEGVPAPVALTRDQVGPRSAGQAQSA